MNRIIAFRGSWRCDGTKGGSPVDGSVGVWITRIGVAVTALLVAVFSAAGVARAAPTVWYVTTAGSDANSCATPNAPCATINAAISRASTGDTIEVAVGTYTGAGDPVVTIDKSVTLAGGWDPAFTSRTGISTVDGQRARRGVVVADAARIERFTVENGLGGGGFVQGGGIRVGGPGSSLALDQSTVKDNGPAGGIWSGAPLTITNSTISGNASNNTGAGGGITAAFGAPLIITNSTLSGNTAPHGGGLLLQSTPAGTTTAQLNNVTIVGNHADSLGGGVSVGPGVTVFLRNSIVAGNTAVLALPDFELVPTTASVVSQGYNLGSGFTNTTGDVFTLTSGVGPLADNGGATQTRALLFGSPAINAIPPNVNGCGTTLISDQRGVRRPQGSGCDIGAFEFALDTTPPVITVPPSTTVNATGQSGAVVTYSVSASDPDDAVASLTCLPPSGGIFPIGTTTVTCTATDTNGNTSSASFTVHVEGASEQVADLGALIAGMGLDRGLANDLSNNVREAADRAAAGETKEACDKLDDLIKKAIERAGDDHPKLTVAQAKQLVAAAYRIELALGCLDPAATAPSGEAALLDLVGAVNGLGLKNGTENELRDKVSDAARQLADGKPAEACKKLNELAKTASKKLTPGELSALLPAIQGPRTAIGC